MTLKVLLPTEVLVHETVTKVIAEGDNGSFCLLPRHMDFTSTLVPGLFAYVSTDGREHYLAVDEGVLVKCGSEVLVSVRRAVAGADLGHLHRQVAEQFQMMDDRERMARSALAKLESDFVRRFIELGKQPYE